ncbi:MAG: TolC family protein [Vicinamibacterales bacterium]
MNTASLSRLVRTACAAAGLVLVATGVTAQPGAAPPLTLSLEEAVARATATSHRVADARARGDAAAAATGGRHATTLPQVNAIGGYTRTNHVDEFGILLPNNQLRVIYPDVPDNYRARLDVQWPVYTAGRLEAIEASARREQSAAERDTDATLADVRLDTTRAFWNLVVAQESLRVVDESLARMAEHVRDARNQVDAGLVPPNEVLTAQAQQARRRMLSIQARLARDLAEADLVRLVGADSATHITPTATLTPPTVPADVAALIGEARQRRPERQALEERVAGAEARQRAADAGRRPTVAVAGGLDYARPNPRIFPRVGDWRESWDAGVNVNWPLFDGGKSRYEAAEASASVRAVRARLAELDSTNAFEIRQRVSEVASNLAALDAADVGVGAATEAHRVIGERFAAGVATSTDVVDAQVAVLQAQLDRTQAIAAARLAEARLNRAIGR